MSNPFESHAGEGTLAVLLGQMEAVTGKQMTGDQSRLLKVGDRVCWRNDQADRGTVTETNWAGVTIKWDNRSQQTILHNDMGSVERVPTNLI